MLSQLPIKEREPGWAAIPFSSPLCTSTVLNHGKGCIRECFMSCPGTMSFIRSIFALHCHTFLLGFNPICSEVITAAYTTKYYCYNIVKHSIIPSQRRSHSGPVDGQVNVFLGDLSSNPASAAMNPLYEFYASCCLSGFVCKRDNKSILQGCFITTLALEDKTKGGCIAFCKWTVFNKLMVLATWILPEPLQKWDWGAT